MLHQSDGADSNAELSVWLAKGDHDWMSALARLKWLQRVGLGRSRRSGNWIVWVRRNVILLPAIAIRAV